MLYYKYKIRKAIEAKGVNMKTLNRLEVKNAYKEIVKKYGYPKSGDIYTEEQLIAVIAKNLCAFDKTNITYEYGKFCVSPSIVITREYASDYTFIGTVVAKEWYTEEQLKALHEVSFGYQF